MRVAAFVIAAVLMAAPVALAQTEVTPPEAVAEAVTQESVTAPTDEEATAPAATEAEAPVATPAPSEERVCRAGPRSESRLRSRQQVCRSRAEWDALDRARSGGN